MADLRQQIERTLAGSRNAFAEVVLRFRDMGLALALRRLDNHALAEEALQEAFALAYGNLASLRDPAAFPGWFRSILLRCCQRIRRRTPPTASLSDLELLQADNELYDPPQLCTRHLEQERVQRLLETLSEPDREVCIQRYMHGRTQQDIAQSLGLPLGTVKRRLHGLRGRMLKSLAAGADNSIRVGHLPISDHLLLMAAHQLHNGRVFEIRPKRYLAWSPLVEALQNGTLDAALIMAPLAMALRNSGLPIRYVLDGHHDGSAVVLRPDAPLHDGVLALPHRISTHSLLLPHLAPSGSALGERTFSPRYISPSYVLHSLQRRSIDGFFCAEPWGTRSTQQGLGRILVRSRDLSPGHCCCILVVREAFCHAHPERLQEFLRLLLSTGDYLGSHHKEGAAIQARYTGVELDIAAQVLDKRHITFTDLRPDPERTGQLMRLAVQRGVLQRSCDLHNFLLPH